MRRRAVCVVEIKKHLGPKPVVVFVIKRNLVDSVTLRDIGMPPKTASNLDKH